MKEQKEKMVPGPQDFAFEYNDFPGCCAVTILHDFGVSYYLPDTAWAELSKSKVAERFMPDLKDYGPLALAVTILKYKGGKEPSLVRGESQAVASKLLRKAGFRQLTKFTGTSGNLLCLWGRVHPHYVPKNKKVTAKKAPSKRRR
jgi:hypothetical protein